jgi:hypothetical protein
MEEQRKTTLLAYNTCADIAVYKLFYPHAGGSVLAQCAFLGASVHPQPSKRRLVCYRRTVGQFD